MCRDRLCWVLKWTVAARQAAPEKSGVKPPHSTCLTAQNNLVKGQTTAGVGERRPYEAGNFKDAKTQRCALCGRSRFFCFGSIWTTDDTEVVPP
jgi:hypothetical protein